MSQYICFDCPSPVGSTEYTPSSQVRFAAEEELGEVVALETLQRGPSKMLLQDRAGQPELNPTSQFCSVQVLEPAGDHSPGGQRLHVAELDAPNTSLLKFWRHKVQDEDPVAGAYEPGLHLLHLGCPVLWVISTGRAWCNRGTRKRSRGATSHATGGCCRARSRRQWWWALH